MGRRCEKKSSAFSPAGIAVSISQSTDGDFLHTDTAKTLTFLPVPYRDVSPSDGNCI